MFIGMFLFWGVVIVGVLLLVKGLFNKPLKPIAQDYPNPRDILTQRYARGEISKAEYDQVLSNLS